MTKKVKLIQKILFAVLAVSTALVCLSFGLRRNSSPVFALGAPVEIQTNGEQEGLFDEYYLAEGNVVFTAEKVGVLAGEVVEGKLVYDLNTTPISTNSSGSDCKYVISADNKKQYYIDISNGTKNRTIIKQGEVVKFDNTLAEDGRYINSQLDNAYHGSTQVELSEAVMISFGQFVYYEDKVYRPSTSEDRGEDVEAPITAGVHWLGKATIEHNGKSETIDVRTITNKDGTYYDFSMIITQQESSNGYYKIVLTDYMIGGESHNMEFDFFILFNSSYSAELTESFEVGNEKVDNQYYAYPTLSWKDSTGMTNGNNISGFIRYKVGVDGLVQESINETSIDAIYYPTLTYDYTKFTMSYTHNANNKRATYTYTFDPSAVVENSVGEATNVPILLTRQYGDEKITKTYNLSAHYDKNRDNNLVSIILTEPGSYVFSYDYIYTGYVPNGMETPKVNEQVRVDGNLAKNLFIHGFELEYSRYEYTEAELKHLTIANSSELTGCIVPDGVTEEETDDLKNGAIGFTYEFTNDTKYKSMRAGSIVKSEQGLIQLEDDDRNTILNVNAATINTITDPTDQSEITELLESINYTNTNQGSLWFKYNDSFVSEDAPDILEYSKFLYSSNKIDSFDKLKTAINKEEGTTGSLEIKEFTNATTFNKTGYYIVIIGVWPKDLDLKSDNIFWQTYAFSFSTDTIEIDVKEYDSEKEESTDKVVGAGSFTCNEVQVTWKPEGTFERDINAYYYTTTNPDLTINQIISNGTKTPIESNAVLGSDSDVKKGEYAKYLLVLESVGGSKTYRMFTIDKQPISGVQAIAVSKQNTQNGFYYTATVDRTGKDVVIKNGITDSMATLNWNNKNSNAKIYAEYQFTPIINDSTYAKKTITTSTESWYTTHYKLGGTIGMFDFNKPSTLSNINYATSIIEDQGIYLFRLYDEAGNSCQYMVIIDRTEAYFKIGEEYLTNTSKIYSTDTTIYTSTHKAIDLGDLELDGETNNNELAKDLYGMIQKIANNQTVNGYYEGDGNNIGNLQTLFTKNGDKFYIKVKNNLFHIYDYQTDSEESNIAIGKNFYHIMRAENVSSIKKFFISGENNIYSGKSTNSATSNSYIIVEINTDNSRGTVLAIKKDTRLSVNDNFDNLTNPGNPKRLITGSDSQDGKVNGLDRAGATSADRVLFTWLTGSGKFQVGTIKYQYYSLDTSIYDSEKYFYKKSGDEVIVYANNVINSTGGGEISADGTRGIFKLYSDNKDTLDGLYVFTREYVDATLDYGDDNHKVNYYFIVDKNSVYTLDDEARNNISLNVLDGETSTHEFQGGYDTETMNGYNYKTYYTTGKVPVTLDIPVAKYMVEENSSNNYLSGRLSYELYFIDYESQLGEERDTVLLSSGKISNEDISSNKFATIDLAQSIERPEHRNKFFVENTHGEWLALPGRYVLVVKDNVRKAESNDTNYFAVGFDILVGHEPEVDFYSGYSDKIEDMVVNYNTNTAGTEIYTSDEFVAFKLQNYQNNQIKDAQLDPNYFYIRQDLGNGFKDYLYNTYDKSMFEDKALDESILDRSQDLTSKDGKLVIDNTDDGRIIYLDTLGIDNYNTVKYEITVRYKLSKSGDSDELHNAYYAYINGERVTFYEKTYTVIIDRQAPKATIDNLIKNDSALDRFTQDKTTFFESKAYGGTDRLAYYTYQYREYYESVANGKTDIGKLYAFRVTGDTKFLYENGSKVYFRLIADPKTHSFSMPIVTTNGYTYAEKMNNSTIDDDKTFKTVFNVDGASGVVGHYYEILEIDIAGNTSQYIVYFDDETKNNTLSMTFKTKTISDDANDTITIGNKKDLLSIITVVDKIEHTTTNEAKVEGYGFYHIEIKDHKGYITNLKLDFSTDIKDIAKNIAQVVSKSYGNYYITIVNSEKSTTQTINYADKDSVYTLNLENLISNNSFVFGQLVQEDEEGRRYFATKIRIMKGTDEVFFEVNTDNGEIIYKGSDGIEYGLGSNLPLEQGVTYRIFIEDYLGKLYSLKYNSNGNQEFNGIVVPAEGEAVRYYKLENTYYSFGNISVWYDTNVYSKETIDLSITLAQGGTIKLGKSQGGLSDVNDSEKYVKWDTEKGIITFYANKGENNEGVRYSVKVEFYEIQKVGDTYTDYFNEAYNIVVDNNVGSVQLKDNGKPYYPVSEYNIDIDDNISTPLETLAGTKTLSWSALNNNYFEYKYYLYEFVSVDTGYIKKEISSDQYSIGINPAVNSDGLHKFIIEVWSKEETPKPLGTKLYAFRVTGEGNELYEVLNGKQEGVKANSTFLFSEIAQKVDNTKYPINSLVRYPLYISNEPLTISKIGDIVQITKEVLYKDVLDVLTLYTINAGSYPQYALIMIVNDLQGKLVSDLRIELSETGVEESKRYPVSESAYTIDVIGKPNDRVELKGYINPVLTADDEDTVLQNLLNKNLLTIDVQYNGVKVDSRLVDVLGNEFSFEIKGNGTYSFSIQDLAGNKLLYGEEEDLIDTFGVNVFREVAVTVNDHAPVTNAYYNGIVELKVTNPSKYVTGSISVVAYKDGEPYIPMTTNPYRFSDYGYYEVTIKAKYFDGKDETEISNFVRFSIINEKEARKSIDLTNLSPYEIIKITDINGNDYTDIFLNEVISANLDNGMLISYENLLRNFSEKLNISSGKIVYNVTYRVTDVEKMYPTRDITFAFALNNEIPTIQCSLGYGESSNKGFDITFNAGAIYDQIGESFVYINDEKVAIIDESSGFGETKISKSFKSDGAKDYYIKLVTSSGVVLNSYKVTITEPLNTWAIILIVVVVAVVATVVIVIIVLRRKMRIR